MSGLIFHAYQSSLNNSEPLDEQRWLSSIISLVLRIHSRKVFRQAQTGKAFGFWLPCNTSAVSMVPLTFPHIHPPHSCTSSYQCSLAYRCSAWLVSISTPVCFTLHLQTNILMERGRVTWLNFWHEKTVTVMERLNVSVSVRACMCLQ